MTEPGRHLWIDASAGVAGDMLLGALLDAGADLERVQAAVDSVIPGSVRVDRSVVRRAGQRATKAEVVVLVDDPPHRAWPTIQQLLGQSDLTPTTKVRALAVFEKLAEAEAHVHGISPADVHFHEVGALDSLADVIGVCAALTDLGVASISGGEVAVGAGRVRTEHGDLPVPVPAVGRLAGGWLVRAGGTGELATPTGMALVTTLSARCEVLPAMVVDGVGVGAGSKDTPERPNVTRVILGTSESGPAKPAHETAVVLEANVDAMDPRLWPGVLERLLSVGASDAWLIPILMKKGRPAHTLSVLCTPDAAAELRDVIFAETSTIGVREHLVRKHALARAWSQVQVTGGSVVIKVAHRGGSIVQATPEFASVAELAAVVGAPVGLVLDQAIAAAHSAGLVPGSPVPGDAQAAEPTRRMG